MKATSFSRILLIGLIATLPVTGFAATPDSNPVNMISDMQKVLDQYKTQIEALQSENRMLRELMAKHEIQIPLEEYNRIMSLPTNSVSSGVTASSSTAPTVTTPTPTTVEGRLALLTPFQRGFITQIAQDWPNIRTAYGLPSDARMAGFEFVKNDAGNHVFADIISGTGTVAGAYNYKLLYEVNTTNFSRKLIGLFEFSDAQKAYITRRGNNPFSALEREFVLNPYGAYFVAPTAQQTPPVATTNTGTTSTQPSVSATPQDVLKQLSNAYQAAQYTQVLTISDAYLANNAPTLEVLRYRYRVYFINKQYTQALAEIKKIQDLNVATSMIYCDAYVIALYAGNQTLANQYKTQAGTTCKSI